MKPKHFTMKPVGIVHSNCNDVNDVALMRDSVSIIEVEDAYVEALYKIEFCEYVDVVFYFHKSAISEETSGEKSGVKSSKKFDLESCSKTGREFDTETCSNAGRGSRTQASALRRKTKSGEERGVFASRAPYRPNFIGITTVKMLSRDGNRLRVTGLDAINGSPVLDIKSCDTSHLDNISSDDIHKSILKSNPRIAIQKHIMAGDTEKLLILAAQIHGHYCPGLAMGVMAAVHAMKELQSGNHYPNGNQTSIDSSGNDGPCTFTDSDGLEDLLAIVETNNCFSDGVQLVTGCSFGNNSLIYHDLGKTAFTLTRRDGNGIRVISRPDSQSYIRSAFPDFNERYKRVVSDQVRDESEVAAYKKSGVERSFGTLSLDFERIFDTKRVTVSIPDYAPTYESEMCAHCGESVMSLRTMDTDMSINEKTGSTSFATPEKGLSSTRKPKLCLRCAGAPFSVLDGHGIRISD